MLGFVSEGAFKQLQACKTSRVNKYFVYYPGILCRFLLYLHIIVFGLLLRNLVQRYEKISAFQFPLQVHVMFMHFLYFFTFLLFGTIFPNNLCTGIQYCFKIAAKIIYFFEMDFDSTNSISTQNKNKPLYFSDLLLVLNNVQSLLLYKNTLHRLNI